MRVQKAPPTPNVQRDLEGLDEVFKTCSMTPNDEKLKVRKYFEECLNLCENWGMKQMSEKLDTEEKYQELLARVCDKCRFGRRSQRLAEKHGVPLPPPVPVAAPGPARKRRNHHRLKGEVEVVKQKKRVSNKDISVFGRQQSNASANRSQSPLTQSQVINPNLPPARLPPTHVTFNIVTVKDEPEDDYLEQGPSSYGTQVDNIPHSPVLASAQDQYSTFGTDPNYWIQAGSEALEREATSDGMDQEPLNISSPSISFSDASQSPISSPSSSGKAKERRFNISFKSCSNLNASFSSSHSSQLELSPPPDYNEVRRGTTGQTASPSSSQTPRSHTPIQASQPNRSPALAGIEFFDQQFFTA